MPVTWNNHKESDQGKATVSKKFPDGSISEAEEEVGEEMVFEDPPASVGVAMGYTKNLGNYESMRMEVRVNLPCHPEKVDDTFDEAKEWVDGRMNQIVTEVEDNLK